MVPLRPMPIERVAATMRVTSGCILGLCSSEFELTWSCGGGRGGALSNVRVNVVGGESGDESVTRWWWVGCAWRTSKWEWEMACK